ncbi:MAG: phospholipase D family protein [Candidatus Micrarchaeota archaeon]
MANPLKQTISIFVLGLLIGSAGMWIYQTDFQSSTTGLATLSNTNSIQPFFCPRDSCANRLSQKISEAKDSVDVAIYSFTSKEIKTALIEAKNNGVTVRVLFDAGQAKSQYSTDEELQNAGILVKRMELERGILHDKFAIIDSQTVATGSFNYSANADEYNKENLVFITDSAIAHQYAAEFENLWNQTI